MIGLTVLAVIAIYIGVFAYIVVYARNRAEKIAAIVVAIAIPFWDLPIGYHNYRWHCAQDGGIQQFESIPPQKALYFASSSGIRPEFLIKAGLDSVEYQKMNGNGVVRYFRAQGGAIEQVEGKTPTSPIRIRATFNEELTWNLYRQEQVLEDAKSGRPLARAREYIWLGGWIQRMISPMLTPASTCYASSLSGVISLAVKGTTK